MMTNSPEKCLEKPKFKHMFETFQNHDVEQNLDATMASKQVIFNTTPKNHETFQ